MPTPEPKRGWFRLSPDRFVISLLLVIGLLWLSDRLQWFGFNHHKGWTVLIAVAAVGVAAVVMLLWWAAGLIFHWRFQFGIRSLLAFCLASSIAVSWLAIERDKAQRQKETVEWVKGLVGSVVYYDWQLGLESNQAKANPEPPGPTWLRKWLGVDFFSAVTAAGFSEGPSDFTDVEMEHLEGLTQLRLLILDGTHITDDGAKHIKRLFQLQMLYLTHTQVTDAGLQSLKGLTQLRELFLNYTLVTDAGLNQLKSLKQLQKLYLNNTLVTDAGLEQLEGLKQLRELNLSFTKVGDDGLKHLGGLTQLQTLNLYDTKITEAGLEYLKGLPQLQELWLNHTEVTDAGVKKLQQALPNCHINH